MRVHIVARPGSAHQTGWGGAFAAGLRRHGIASTMAAGVQPCDLLVLWGVRRQAEIAAQKARGGEVCVLERGYLGDRFAWTSVSFGGGLNGRAEFRGVSKDPARFEEHHGHLLKGWTETDGYTLLVGQVPGDMSLMGRGGRLDGWYADAAARLQAQGHEVYFRPHPLAARHGPTPAPKGVRAVGGTLEGALAEASLVVTFNSNSGVESVLAGVPTMAADEGSMAWPVASHAVEDAPRRPDRMEWAAEMAWKQWTMAELESGDCWAHVGTGWSEKQCA